MIPWFVISMSVERQRAGLDFKERLAESRLFTDANHFQEGTLGSFQRLPVLTGLTVGVWDCEALRFFFIAMPLNLIGGRIVHIVSAAFFIALGEALLTVVPFTGGGVGLVVLILVILLLMGRI